VGWFTKKRTAEPEQVGIFLAAYVHEELMTASTTNQLRELLSLDGVPPDRRESFDDSLYLFALFVAFVAARHRFPLATAERVLNGALAPILSQCNQQEASAIRARLDRYHHLCRSAESRGKELAALTYCACVDLYDDEARDAFLMMPVTVWVTAYMKMFDDFLAGIDVTVG